MSPSSLGWRKQALTGGEHISHLAKTLIERLFLKEKFEQWRYNLKISPVRDFILSNRAINLFTYAKTKKNASHYPGCCFLLLGSIQFFLLLFLELF